MRKYKEFGEPYNKRGNNRNWVTLERRSIKLKMKEN